MLAWLDGWEAWQKGLAVLGLPTTLIGLVRWRHSLVRGVRRGVKYVRALLRAPLVLEALESERERLPKTVRVHGVRVGRSVLGSARSYFCDLCFQNRERLFEMVPTEDEDLDVTFFTCQNCETTFQLAGREAFDVIHASATLDALDALPGS